MRPRSRPRPSSSGAGSASAPRCSRFRSTPPAATACSSSRAAAAFERDEVRRRDARGRARRARRPARRWGGARAREARHARRRRRRARGARVGRRRACPGRPARGDRVRRGRRGRLAAARRRRSRSSARTARSRPTTIWPAQRTPSSRRRPRSPLDVDGAAPVVTLQLGQPPLGALQLRFAPGRVPDEHGVAQLAQLRRPRRARAPLVGAARDAGFELERSRALLSVVGEAISRLSLSHTLETAIERVADLLGADRVAVYLRDGDEIAVAASRGIEGPHEAVADALLAAALRRARRASIVEVDAPTDERLAPVRAQVAESGIDSRARAAARRRRRADRRPRRLPAPAAPAERQRARAAGRARRHSSPWSSRTRGCTSDARRSATSSNELLASEREAAKRLHAHYEISRSFAQSLSLETTLDALAASIVDLLGVDAAVIRMPDERGIELTRAGGARQRRAGRSGRADAALAAAAAAAPRPARPCSARGEPLLLDADRAESLGGALALLAPFLRKGSSAALIPIATPAELLATLTIVSLHPGRPVAGEIAETALSIAGQAALAIDNARLYGQQKAFADTMQRSLLPRAAPELPGLELGDVYESAATARGRRRRLRLPDARRRPARRRPRRRHRPRRRRDRRHGDGEVRLPLARARAPRSRHVPRRRERGRLLRDRAGPVHHDGRARDRRRGAARSRARAPAIRRRGSCSRTARSRSIPARGLALGIDAPQAYETVTEPFPPGAIVVVYTDGVIEARRGGEQFGVERLDALLAERRELPPQEIARGGARRVPRLDRGRAHRRLRRRRDQASPQSKARRHEPQPGSSRGARLRRRHRLARDRDRRLADARAVLRLVDDRLGEPDRDRARRARGRLLARRPARRPAARAPPARADRARGGALGRDDAVRRPAVPRRGGRQPRRRLRRRRDRLVLRRAAPVRAGGRPARDGLAVRDPARDHRRRERRRGRRPLLRALDGRLAGRHLRAGADRDPARRARSGRCS